MNLNKRIIEGYTDFIKRDPVGQDLIRRILEVGNSDRFKKNNMSIQQYVPVVKSLSDKGSLKNMACFKIKFPEKFNPNLNMMGRPYFTDTLFLFIRKVKGKFSGNKAYLIDSNFEGYFMSLEEGRLRSIWEYSEDDVISYVSGICRIKEDADEDKKTKSKIETHTKKFTEKFDQQYIRDVLADIISLCPDPEINYRTPFRQNSGVWVVKLNTGIEMKSSHEYDFNDKTSELYEHLSIAYHRFKDDGLKMSVKFGEGNEHTSSMPLYIFIGDKNEIEQPKQNDYFP